ncbi:cellulase family glycosylhydrolase [Reinekea sp. G2M2-21]|uniref:cellulase family glycosylhydrolase n=1 Tax=Reinekea sp. G2M2-21 TaxID=2788942 RepID=UPI0018A8A159|nr:cellulase family glycosylhydrolase [Reinekea sp. G2M2-21]
MNIPFRLKLATLALASCFSLTPAQAGTPLPGDDWLHVEGNQILDQNNNPVWLTGVNWFGFNASERVFHGLWSVNLDATMAAIAQRGINLIRVPISTELLKEWKNGIYKMGNVNTYVNPELEGKHSLEVFDAMLTSAKRHGLKILLDVHSAEADNSGHYEKLWYKGDITSEDFYDTWVWVADRYKNDDTILAFDLENEPHGQPWSGAFAKWDNSTDEHNWKYACETAANRILDVHPNILVMCEGIEAYPKDGKTWSSQNKSDYHSIWWGGNLRGVADYPVDLGSRQSQLMYSPHDYGPLVFQQPWFYEGFNKDTLYTDVWKDNWLYIHEQNIAPLLIGEWGGFMDGGDNETWMRAIRDLIIEHKLHHTFWCLNPNSGDTGGLLLYDWTSWDEEKYALFEPSLWQDAQGKYVGLDHQVILGSSATGTNVSEYYNGSLPATITLTSPAPNRVFTPGSDVLLQYQMSGAAGVNVYLDNQLHTQSTSTSQAIVQAPAVANQLFVVTLVATNAQGDETSARAQVTLQTGDVNQDPSIRILQPATHDVINIGESFNVAVDLQFASAFYVNWNGDEEFIDASSTVLTAPNTAGNYLLSVTAANAAGEKLSATESLTVRVTEPTSTTLSCELPTADAWPGGFVLNNIRVTNEGAEPITDWQATLTFDQNVSVVNGWSGEFTQQANQVTVTPVDHNRQLAPGQTATFGFQGSLSGSTLSVSCSVE